jgi:hypothetical protein
MTPRTFTDSIGQLRYGKTATELSEQFQALVQQCQTTGKPGSITFTINLKPGRGGQIEISDEIKVKLPKPERGTSLMFATEDGHLQRSDPRQGELDGLRTVDKETGEIRQVAKA